MSLFGALNTAVSGLNAQSAAFGNIGDNVANSQTVGFKRVDTNFIDYVTASSQTTNQPGAVQARADYVNDVQGAVSQTDNPLDLAISGNGFFTVDRPVGENRGAPVFGQNPSYTRTGDFKLNNNGYLVNGSGDYLAGWTSDASGAPDQTKTAPIQVDQSGIKPLATQNVTLGLNLPASSDGTPFPTTIPVVDSLGRDQTLNLTWTPTAGTPNTWDVSVAQAGSTSPLGSARIAFGAAGNPAAPEGTVGSISGSGGVAGSTYAANGAATIAVNADFGSGAQPITFSLGKFGQASGLTQFAGTTANVTKLSNDGVKAGSYTGVSLKSNGDVSINYDNGQSRVVARVPITTFANPDALHREDGQAFTVTQESGSPQTLQVGSNGAGTLVTSAVEGSNVDIASEFTKLIVAQRAYSANTKMVTTADDMLSATIDMKR